MKILKWNDKNSEINNCENFFYSIGGLRKAVDYNAIYNYGAPITIIITERKLRVKTYGAKKFTHKKWLENNKKPNTLFLRNLQDDIKLETSSFLSDVPEEMNNLKYNSIGGVGRIEDDEKNIYCYFGAVSTPRSKRGSRTHLDFIVWDEFNDSIKFLGNDIVSNFLNILSSTNTDITNKKNDRRAFILGNNRTINHPLLLSLGVSYIENELTHIYDMNNKPLALIILPFLTKEEIDLLDKEKINDWEYQLAKLTGNDKHIYSNMSDKDMINGIYRYINLEEKIIHNFFYDEEIKLDLVLNFTFKVNNRYLNIYAIPKLMQTKIKSRFHVIDISLLVNEFRKQGIKIDIDKCISPLIWTTSAVKQNINESLLDSNSINVLREKLAKNEFSFENISSKSLFIDLINKK